jgi:hypothetical protein
VELHYEGTSVDVFHRPTFTNGMGSFIFQKSLTCILNGPNKSFPNILRHTFMENTLVIYNMTRLTVLSPQVTAVAVNSWMICNIAMLP